jgi:VIT1/CCC1 family predicted Fe2+/Mn2+ transporter
MSQLSVLQEWLTDAKGGNCFQKGSEARLWEDTKSAFVAIKSSAGEQDTFTCLFTKLFTGVYHRIWGESTTLGTVVDEESGLMSYDESKINLCSQIFTTIISSILPVLTILVLYIIHSTYWRIAASIVFTALFSAFLAIFSTARRVEIFAATAT